jgi:hypothetical protein
MTYTVTYPIFGQFSSCPSSAGSDLCRLDDLFQSEGRFERRDLLLSHPPLIQRHVDFIFTLLHFILKGLLLNRHCSAEFCLCFRDFIHSNNEVGLG